MRQIDALHLEHLYPNLMRHLATTVPTRLAADITYISMQRRFIFCSL
jgi:hypothetical protein